MTPTLRFLLNNQFCLDALSSRWKIDYSNRVKKINAFYLKLGYNFVILKLTLKSRHIRLWSLYPVYQSSRKLGKLCLQLSEWRGEFGPQQPNCRNHQVLSLVHTYFRDTWDGKFKQYIVRIGDKWPIKGNIDFWYLLFCDLRCTWALFNLLDRTLQQGID